MTEQKLVQKDRVFSEIEISNTFILQKNGIQAMLNPSYS